MSTGINSNISALSAQLNLAKADDDSRASIYRLSSGNAIYKASDNVAGLAIGTSIKTDVSTLQTAVTNTAQALSMLGVADGGIATQSDIAQRLKSLASQATSGSLSDVNRGFLNAELQNLIKENDRIASSTNFNGINLLDGSLYAPSKLSSSTLTNATTASGSATIATALADTNNFFVNGVTIAAHDTANMVAGNALQFDVTANSTAAQQATAIYNVIQDTLNYQGTDATTLVAKEKLGQLSYSHTAGSATIGFTAKVAGTIGNGAASGAAFGVGADTATNTDVTVNGQNASAVTVTTAVGIGTGAAANIAINGSLSGGTFGTTAAYSGTARTIAQGNVADSILKSITPITQATTGVDASQVSNNSAFVGDITKSNGGFEASYVANNQLNVNIKVGNYTYEARNVITNPTADTVVTFSSVEPSGGSFNIQLASGKGLSNIVDQNSADIFGTRLNAAMSGVSFYQNRDVNNYVSAGTVYPAGSTNTAIGDLAGSSFKMINSDFSSLEISDVKVTAPAIAGTNATIKVTVNGEEYVSGFDGSGTALAAGTNFSDAISAGSYGLVSTTNPKNMLVFNYASGTNLNLSSSANAQGFENALLNAFGVNQGASGVSFQVGTKSTDNIGIQVKSTLSTDIFKDSNGNYQSLDISTLAGAQAAGGVLDTAINNLTTIRAGVGAIQERFNYASAGLSTTIQNQEAARATYLDTDIAVESMKFSQAQVRLQASVSVLAQANQMPQNLLKLIG